MYWTLVIIELDQPADTIKVGDTLFLLIFISTSFSHTNDNKCTCLIVPNI